MYLFLSKSKKSKKYFSKDIDECKMNLDNCESECVNLIGSFECTCFDGYKLINSNKCEKGKVKIIYILKV